MNLFVDDFGLLVCKHVSTPVHQTSTARFTFTALKCSRCKRLLGGSFLAAHRTRLLGSFHSTYFRPSSKQRRHWRRCCNASRPAAAQSQVTCIHSYTCIHTYMHTCIHACIQFQFSFLRFRSCIDPVVFYFFRSLLPRT
jgi:hypothetical protein